MVKIAFKWVTLSCYIITTLDWNFNYSKITLGFESDLG